jgi:hypothetical protein
MSTPDISEQTEDQSRRIETLPEGHTVVTAKGHRIVVRRPDGRLARIRPGGRLVAMSRVETVESYLDVRG